MLPSHLKPMARSQKDAGSLSDAPHWHTTVHKSKASQQPFWQNTKPPSNSTIPRQLLEYVSRLLVKSVIGALAYVPNPKKALSALSCPGEIDNYEAGAGRQRTKPALNRSNPDIQPRNQTDIEAVMAKTVTQSLETTAAPAPAAFIVRRDSSSFSDRKTQVLSDVSAAKAPSNLAPWLPLSLSRLVPADWLLPRRLVAVPSKAATNLLVEEPVTQMASAIQKQQEQVVQLNKKLHFWQHRLDTESADARQMRKKMRPDQRPSAKMTATLKAKMTATLKRMKTYQTAIAQIEGMQGNLQASIQDLELNGDGVNQMFVEATRAGNDVARAILEHRSPDDVADIMDEAAELQEDAAETASLLAEPFGGNADDAVELYNDFFGQDDADSGGEAEERTFPNVPTTKVQQRPELVLQPPTELILQ